MGRLREYMTECQVKGNGRSAVAANRASASAPTTPSTVNRRKALAIHLARRSGVSTPMLSIACQGHAPSLWATLGWPAGSHVSIVSRSI